MFFVFNFLIFLSSLGMLGGDIFLFVTLRPTIFQYVFLIISLTLLVFSLLSFYLRRSVHLLGFYLLIEFATFIASMLSTILLYIKREALIDEVIDYNKDWEEPKKIEMKKILNDNIKNVFIAMLFFTLILVSSIVINLLKGGAFVSGLCYRSSVKGRTQDLKDHLVDEFKKDERNA